AGGGLGIDHEGRSAPTPACSRAAAAPEIELLRASLAARDDEGWRRGTERVGHLLSEGFDPNVATLATARDIVSELSAARLVPAAPAPESTLRELGNLRAMRSLVRAPPPSPAPALEAPEPPAHEDDENGEDSHDADTDEDDS
ncbi:MAG TPA: hypothetical protein PKZ76_18480, partial [Xanthomonadaceae bacterium]|nr:hypothetical protein [Xanthomonadaceae bacterium]